tara:strand:- start:152 stop:883 length:732 start_codon:yes stop_codon:yes gene_type:complete
MFLDATALGLSWWSLILSHRTQHGRLSYGYHRYQVLASFLNGLMLIGLILWILVEAYSRLNDPETMLPLPALIVASVGLFVNLTVYRILHNKNQMMVVRSAQLHVLSDILGSISAILSALIVFLSGWYYADVLFALIITIILGRGAWSILKDATHILLEGVPNEVDLPEISRTLVKNVAEVQEIHHIHAWGLTAEMPLLTLHANIMSEGDLENTVKKMKLILKDNFNIDHSTIQVEYGKCPDE